MMYEDKKDETSGLMKGFEIFKNKPSLQEAMLQRQKEFMEALGKLSPIEVIKVDELPEVGESGKMYVTVKEVPAIVEGKEEIVVKTRVYAYVDGEYILADDITSEAEGQ